MSRRAARGLEIELDPNDLVRLTAATGARDRPQLSVRLM